MKRRTLVPLAAAALLPALALLAGCGSSSSVTDLASSAAPTSVAPSTDAPSSASPSTPAASSPAPSTSADDTLRIAVTIADGKVSPSARTYDVAIGQPVELTVTSDADDIVHVHGADLEEDVKAGGTVTLDFTLEQAGVTEVEGHESDLVLLKLAAS